MADPDFDSEPTSDTGKYLAMDMSPVDSDLARGPSDRSDCLNNLYQRLPATRKEQTAVAAVLRGELGLRVDEYSGSDAMESVAKFIDMAPRILHLATHGYFCQNAQFSGETELEENPLLYSGLIMSGGNRLIAGELGSGAGANVEDGILTSLEASGLNLFGTELVVLSACQTGLGQIENSEGVYGLCRAFQLAGARSVIMSMFSVPDKSTVTLMERFYRDWLSGNSKASALRQASLSILQERRETHGAAHPLFWGGFILVGDPY